MNFTHTEAFTRKMILLSGTQKLLLHF